VRNLPVRVLLEQQKRRALEMVRRTSMEKQTLRAHFDGSQILLDEPFEIEPNTELIVTIVPKSSNGESGD